MGTELPEGMVPLTPTIQNTSDNSLPDGMVPLQGSAAITSQPSEQPSNGGDPRYKYQMGMAETALSMGSGLVGSATAGIVGTLKTPFSNDDWATNITEIQDAMTYIPKTEEGQKMNQWVGQSLDTIMKTIKGGVAAIPQATNMNFPGAIETFKSVQDKGLGEHVFEQTGSPLAATLA